LRAGFLRAGEFFAVAGLFAPSRRCENLPSRFLAQLALFQAGFVWHTRCPGHWPEAVNRLIRPRVEITMTAEITSPGSFDGPAHATVGERAAARLGDYVELDSCPELDWITVTTSRSTYDVVVLSGDTGAVMVRGGRLFPKFRRATITGSLFDGIAVKLRTIAVGLNLEFFVDGMSVITSRIQAISRHHLAVAEGRA
jgi:hypothetical protein